MVDMEVIRERAVKGAFVGVGAFGAGMVENVIEDNLDTGDLVTSALQLGVGLGTSVGVDEVFDNPESLPNDMVEYVGYGVQGAAWSNMAEFVQTGELAGSNTVTVRSDGGAQTSQQAEVVEIEETATTEAGERPFAAEVA